MSRFTREELIERAFLRLARMMYEQWEEFGGGDTRLFDWLIPHDYVCIGTSAKGGGYCEHLVPRAMIRDQCVKMFKKGASIEAVAQSIRANLKVADITREEARHIDTVLGFRTTMPPDWKFESGDFMARLRAGNVEIIPGCKRKEIAAPEIASPAV